MNNRQGGRRRGRGGQRPQGMPGNSSGARDNRQRGNAAQLLEKYKNLARDSQLAGDRVQTEYYLQFADHYFRVLGETRSRFEDQRRPHEDEELDEDGYEADGDDERSEQPARFERQERPERRRDRERAPRTERDRDDGEVREPRDRSPREGRVERRVHGGERAEGRSEQTSADNEDRRLTMDFLPPAIGVGESDVAEGATPDSPRPRRRVVRRPKAVEGEGEIAPAA